MLALSEIHNLLYQEGYIAPKIIVHFLKKPKPTFEIPEIPQIQKCPMKLLKIPEITNNPEMPYKIATKFYYQSQIVLNPL
jgi:hypothetical protein